MKTLFLSIACLLASVAIANGQTATSATATDSLSAYAGTYTFESGSPLNKFVVSAEKGELFGEADSYGKNKLVKQAKADTYQSTSSYGSIITFVRNAATKAVTGLTLAIQGTELSAKKE